MRASDWKVWRYLDSEEEQWIIDNDAFRKMVDQGWHCRSVLWVKGSEQVCYPYNLFADIKKINSEKEWPEKAEALDIQGFSCAFNSLQNDVQSILRLRYQQGATYNQIAELMDLSVSGIRMIVRKAIRDFAEDPFYSLLTLGLDGYINQQTAIRNNPYETFCVACGQKIALSKSKEMNIAAREEKMRRIADIDKLHVHIKDVEFGGYGFTQSDAQYGFTIVAEIANISTRILAAQLEDFYIVENGTRINASSRRREMNFVSEVLAQGEVCQLGWIWYAKQLESFGSFTEDTSVVISLRLKENDELLVFKFDYRGDHFEIDDYSAILDKMHPLD